MRTTIDKAGRVVIPAAIRAQAGFVPGTVLEVEIVDGSVRLVRSVPGPRLERVGKLLLARPRAPGKDRPGMDVAKLVEDERNRWPL
jgi:AbrB family looped-hinge helix DNA binding protein